MLLALALLLLIATFSTKLAEKVGIPGLIIFLGLGMLFGSDGLNFIYFDDALFAQQIAIAFLIIILFEGGFNTQRKLMKLVYKPALFLSTIGVVITAVIIGLFGHYVIGLSLYSALLIGAIVSSTDAAAVFSSLKNKKIHKKTAATLEIESATNDPIAIIMTITLIQLIQGTWQSPLFFLTNLGWQIFAGVLIGVLIGKIGPYLFNKARLDIGGFYFVLSLGLCFLSYSLADELGGNGFLAVFIAGYFIGNSNFIFKNSIFYFIEGISTFSQVMLFLMLGLLVFPSEVLLYWKEGIIIAMVLILIARPFTVLVTSIIWKFTWKQGIFLSWGGIKGAVPIVLAIYPFAAGVNNANYYFNMVFFVVLISALVQGSTIDYLATKLKLYFGKRKPHIHSFELISLEKSKCELVDYSIKKDSHLIGKRIYELQLPKDSLITGIVRDNDIVTPRGNTIIKEEDDLFLLVRLDDKERLLSILESENDDTDTEEDNVKITK